MPNDISAKTRHVLITTTVKRSFPAGIASRSFTWGVEIRIANPFIRANPIRRPSRYAGTARENHSRAPCLKAWQVARKSAVEQGH